MFFLQRMPKNELRVNFHMFFKSLSVTHFPGEKGKNSFPQYVENLYLRVHMNRQICKVWEHYKGEGKEIQHLWLQLLLSFLPQVIAISYVMLHKFSIFPGMSHSSALHDLFMHHVTLRDTWRNWQAWTFMLIYKIQVVMKFASFTASTLKIEMAPKPLEGSIQFITSL